MGEAIRDRRRDEAMPFTAKYNSRCPLCDKEVHKGQSVIFAELRAEQPRKVVHTTCYYQWKGEQATDTWETRNGPDGTVEVPAAPGDAESGDTESKEAKPEESSAADAPAQPEQDKQQQDGGEQPTPPKPDVPPAAPDSQPDNDDLLARLAKAIEPHLNLSAPEPAAPAIDTDAVRAIAKQVAGEAVAKAVAKVTAPLRVEVVQPDMPVVDVGLAHFRFPELLAAVAAGENVWVAGPAGTGKTHAAEAVAKALGKPFYYCGAVSEPYSLIGFIDAAGRTIRTPFREAYENGGVFLWDEVDASSPNALLAFSGALANGHCPFPDGMVARHEDCRIIATANTYGHGATSDYVGRCKIDAATLDRFTQLDWPLDEKLEAALCPNHKWLGTVRKVRKAVESNGIRVLITPRASIRGARLLAAGLPEHRVREMVLRRGMTEDQWKVVGGAA